MIEDINDWEKIERYDEMNRYFWEMAKEGNLLQSAMFAALIRQFKMFSPDGDDPENA